MNTSKTYKIINVITNEVMIVGNKFQCLSYLIWAMEWNPKLQQNLQVEDNA